MGLRDDQVAHTRRVIVDCFRDLSAGPTTEPVTVAEVARASKIAPATIYRHFRNRDELVRAAASAHSYDGVDAESTWGLGDLHAHLVHLWTELEQNLAVTREGAVSPAGREMRVARFVTFRDVIGRALAADRQDIDAHEASQLTSAIALLSSVHAFLDLHDRQGLTAREAADTVAWTVAELLRARGIDPESLRMTDDPEHDAGHHAGHDAGHDPNTRKAGRPR